MLLHQNPAQEPHHLHQTPRRQQMDPAPPVLQANLVMLGLRMVASRLSLSRQGRLLPSLRPRLLQ